jgi:thiopurine S-methyltransferase
MDGRYWLDRWTRGEISFHEGAPNRWLEEHVALLGPGAGRRVLVPLCGKSIDLAFLAAHGFEVVGVELSREAAQAFFDEAGLAADVVEEGARVRMKTRGIEIVVGDFFALGAADVGVFDAYYDRAAVVALPPFPRERYATTLASLVREDAPGLVVTFEHDGPADAPPFSVTTAELARLWPSFAWQGLGEIDVLGERSSFRARGATFAIERAYAVRVR